MATQKQKLVLQSLLENAGNPKPLYYTMIEAGYSPKVAKTPARILESKGMKELLDTYLPDEDIAREHKELLNQKRIDYFVFPKNMEDEEISEHVRAAGLEVIVVRQSDKGKMAFYSLPDAQAKKAALDMAYKLKGSYAPVKSAVLHGGHVTVTEKQQRIADKYADELKKTFIE